MTSFGLRAPRPEIVVADGLYERPDEVRAFALSQEFRPSPYHKGRRTGQFLFPGLRERFEDLLRRRITEWESHGMNGTFQVCVGGDQVVFHSDIQSHAAVVYLTPGAPPGAGTSFWRSRETGIRRAPGRGAPGAAALEERTYYGKLLDPTAWDLVDSVGNVYNRLVLWDGRMIHSASCYFGANKGDGRLFHIFFFGAE